MGASNAKGRRCYITNFDDISVSVEASDIEIGAVELKNAATDDRVLVAASGGTPTFGLAVLPVIANAAAPTLTEAKVAYLSTDLKGNLRTLDGGAAWTASNGIAGARFTSADASGAVASVTSAPTAGQKLVITDIIISVDTAMRVDFNVESSATVIESVYMAANSTVNFITRSKRKLATADKKLQVQTSAAGNISVNAYYYSEA